MNIMFKWSDTLAYKYGDGHNKRCKNMPGLNLREWVRSPKHASPLSSTRPKRR